MSIFEISLMSWGSRGACSEASSSPMSCSCQRDERCTLHGHGLAERGRKLHACRQNGIFAVLQHKKWQEKDPKATCRLDQVVFFGLCL
jgi:hypothetical protein